MTERLSGDSENIPAIAASIYDDCRSNVDLYDSPTGFGIEVGNVNWQIIYWRAYTDETGGHMDSVRIVRDFSTHQNPVSYGVMQDGTILKDEKIAHRISGGVYYDPNGTVQVDDPEEARLLRSIVSTAHTLRRNAINE